MKDDLILKEAFAVILSIKNMDRPFLEMAELVYTKGINTTKQDTLEVMAQNNIENYNDFKKYSLELVLRYIRIALRDNHLTQTEKRNVQFLKNILNVKEGDFYSTSDYIYDELSEIIRTQLSLIYLDDDKIDKQEALHKVDLQELFDLSYDQFLDFANVEDQRALDRGADIRDLDTVYFDALKSSSDVVAGREISQVVKDKVWNRDDGKCSQCGSKENLEFDHIIPFSKGGANTYRNIQLLCQSCNREKSDQIG
ncbi:MAG: HNH endonuclease signature motif containing protein [Ignavibacteria bacterium]|nr:HNH endonuclease signature motif containing protein [Ignavibacteria bacterium]